MTALDDERTAIELAVLTEDRTDNEQRALLRMARRVDQRANRQTVTNPRWQAHERDGAEWTTWDLESLVDATRVIDPDDKQHVVRLPARRGR